VDYLENPDLELLENEGSPVEKGGRPPGKRQRVHHTLTEPMNFEQAEP